MIYDYSFVFIFHKKKHFITDDEIIIKDYSFVFIFHKEEYHLTFYICQ